MTKRTYWWFTMPSVILMVVLMVFPLVTTLWLSTQKLLLRDLRNPSWVGFGNYTEVLGDPDFWQAVRYTLLFVIITVPIQMAFGLAVALLLDRVGRGRSFYMAALLLPFIVTPVVGSLVYKDLFERGGLLSWLIESATGSPFTVSAGNVTWLIMIQSIWHVMPFAMITFFAGLQSLPEERLEAASLDGASAWAKLRHIKVPHLRSLITFVGLISVMDAYRVYDTVYVWAGDRFTNAQTLTVYNVEVASSFDIGRLGKGNAIAVLTVIGIFVVLIPFLYRTYKEQMEER